MWWLAAVAWAHEPGLSRLSLRPDALELSVSAADAQDAAGLLAGVKLSRGGQACAVGAPVSRPDTTDGDAGTAASASLACPEAGALELEATWLGALAPGHRTLVEHDGKPVAWLDGAHRTMTLELGAAPRSSGRVALDYLGLGVEHILTGYDHLLFLAGLLLGVRSFRQAAAVVTGFTLAHSVTLSLAALGLVTVPAWLVEPVIALTIVWVGIENLLARSSPTRRVVLTSLLGLVHGLGFAGLLGELGLPKDALLVALLSFNGGVELGQFAVVLVVLPLLLRLSSEARWRDQGVRVASVIVGLVGAFWFVERVLGNLG